MAEQRGKLVTCDRCGESIFVKELKVEEKDRDGGFTRWNEYTYEGISSGWTKVSFTRLHIGSPVCYQLCPDCTKIFDRAYNQFFGIEEADDDPAAS